MPGVTRQTDLAGGPIQQGSGDVFIEGLSATVQGTRVQSHGPSTHATATMAGGSSTVFVNGKPLIRSGDRATCGHTAAGSSTVFAG